MLGVPEVEAVELVCFFFFLLDFDFLDVDLAVSLALVASGAFAGALVAAGAVLGADAGAGVCAAADSAKALAKRAVRSLLMSLRSSVVRVTGSTQKVRVVAVNAQRGQGVDTLCNNQSRPV